MQRVREYLTLVLIGLLPFHAFLVTVFTKIIKGNGNAPLTLLALWKEMLIVIILLIACVEVYKLILHPESRKKVLKLDTIDWLIISFLALALIVTAFTFYDLKSVFLGIKYDIFPLGVFFLLRRVKWSANFTHIAFFVLLMAGLATAVIGVISILLPSGFFQFLGYSNLHSLYLPNAPLAAYQQIGGTGIRRIQSTMSGPNQFGLWLLIPWSVCLFGLAKSLNTDSHFLSRIFSIKPRSKHSIYTYVLCLLLIATAIFLTFSRSAWIASFSVFVLFLFTKYSAKSIQRISIRAIAPLIFAFALIIIIAPEVVLRAASSVDHIRKPIEGIYSMVQNPLGKGLSSAGPASNHLSDSCVFLPDGADISWAKDRTDLCVFAGGIQMQPIGKICSCPFVTENWYIQIGVELGFIGFLIFSSLIVLILMRLWKIKDESYEEMFAIFLGVSISALLLHSFEDAALAYTVWILLATVLCKKYLSKEVENFDS
ncbi:hypothetical protein HN512_03090 [Candidatus Peregrinibacteria bacterium]|jgi:multisubunit Na+/H+ antiporter MnhF subunit|nr:hypothetical protein [Candidatus Peregrinibacteria bacterium]MBT3598798.1 hypothetical protein [Candidatus Peregrinibacteria bacterium]MBT4366841.1 hypothetical protein [Candidatus Peregrinibacteria bacterium]MBT6731192.1 hypothetical protein [Candidatus Peregrinibacteria bacterium]MBT7009232.1 hypothetical protein [Candidatus Peregrinibacteria bacterium]